MVKGVPRNERRTRAADALRMVRLEGYEKRKPSQMSGGQRQRVALARALVNRPKVLLLDEPLGALDLKLREEMQIELKAIQTEVGITFIYVTHDQVEALTMSDRIGVVNAGRLEQVDTPAEIYERPRTAFVAGFVGTSNLIRGGLAEKVVGRSGIFTVRPEKIRLASIDEQVADGESTVLGTVRGVAYEGPDTRYFVTLEDGTELVVTSQNLRTSSMEVLALQGTQVRLVWAREHNLLIAGSEKAQEEDS
jgi:putative spermidine/putrescine transport system ATP-binding protein